MHEGLKLSAGPASEPVTLAVMKEHLHYDPDDQDDRITALIKVARESAEIHTRRAFFTQTWTLALDKFPKIIYVPRPPLASVTSITYTDTAGDEQTLSADDYQVDTISEPARIAPSRLASWPSIDNRTLSGIVVTYVAGWNDVADIPEDIQHAIKLLGAHWFEHLEEVTLDGTPKELPFAAKMLLNNWKIPEAY